MLEYKPITIKINIDDIIVGSKGYITDYANGMYEVYIPEYNTTVFLNKDEFE